jgi:type IV secretion system protein VirB8
MKKKTDQATYFAEAASWASDRNDALRSSRRVAWIVAGAASTVAACEALAIVIMMPLKTIEPYTLLVDRQTGFVQALKPLDPQMVSADRALTQSFLVQYVIAREGYDYATLQSDYRKVGLWSAGRARASYLATMQASNPDSPLVRLPRTSVVDVRVKSVTPMSEHSAMVRYDTQRRDAGAQPQPAQSWVAVVRYRYTGEPASVADRFVNPLGFQVESFRRSQEALPPATPAPSAQP